MQQKLVKRAAFTAFVVALTYNTFYSYAGFSKFDFQFERQRDEKVPAAVPRTPFSVSDAIKKTDKSAASREIKKISLLGERNSGTTWMLKELRRCYNETFVVENRLRRHKHYFQFDDGASPEPSLVVSEFRNPYQWTLAMVDKPRRSTAHRAMDWKTFVTTPWTTERAPSDLKYANSTGRVCQEKFRYDEVVCCEKYPPADEYVVYKDKHRPHDQSIPIYEMNPRTLQPYQSVVDMRADKIRNHAVEVKEFDFVKDVVIVLYEELISKGTQPLLDQITKITGKQPHCAATPPQPDRPLRPMPDGFKEWMDEHVDWDAEAIVGYSKQ